VEKLAVKQTLGILRMRCDLVGVLRKFVLENGIEDGEDESSSVSWSVVALEL
jgi:hypothetical protein